MCSAMSQPRSLSETVCLQRDRFSQESLHTCSTASHERKLPPSPSSCQEVNKKKNTEKEEEEEEKKTSRTEKEGPGRTDDGCSLGCFSFLLCKSTRSREEGCAKESLELGHGGAACIISSSSSSEAPMRKFSCPFHRLLRSPSRQSGKGSGLEGKKGMAGPAAASLAERNVMSKAQASTTERHEGIMSTQDCMSSVVGMDRKRRDGSSSKRGRSFAPLRLNGERRGNGLREGQRQPLTRKDHEAAHIKAACQMMTSKRHHEAQSEAASQMMASKGDHEAQSMAACQMMTYKGDHGALSQAARHMMTSRGHHETPPSKHEEAGEKKIMWREGLLQRLGRLHGLGNCKLSLEELIELDDNACLEVLEGMGLQGASPSPSSMASSTSKGHGHRHHNAMVASSASASSSTWNMEFEGGKPILPLQRGDLSPEVLSCAWPFSHTNCLFEASRRHS